MIVRGLRAEAVIPPASRTRFVVAHLGVRPELPSQGIGRALLEHLIEVGRARGIEIASLDVAATNPRGQALYERVGFAVTAERRSRLSNASGTLPDHRHMERAI